jgi:phosphohistidine phosphatase
MKTLLLMRHAKSSWKNAKLTDHERPLAKRGHRDAAFMGEALKEKELLPQKVLASTAVRVSETLAEFVKSSGCSAAIEYLGALYLAEPETYLTALRGLPDDVERVMVVGHNPGLEGLLQQLTGRIEPIETATVAYISLPIATWAELAIDNEGELVELMVNHAPPPEKAKKGKKESKKDEPEVEKKIEKKEEKKDEKKGSKKDEIKVEKKEEKKADRKEVKKEVKKVDKKEDKKEEKKADKKVEKKDDKKAK